MVWLTEGLGKQADGIAAAGAAAGLSALCYEPGEHGRTVTRINRGSRSYGARMVNDVRYTRLGNPSIERTLTPRKSSGDRCAPNPVAFAT